jgi:hypothetical protein
MSQNPIYNNVRGAPFRIGESVRVVGSEDETFDPRCDILPSPKAGASQATHTVTCSFVDA